MGESLSRSIIIIYYELSHKRKNLEEIPSSKRSMYKKRFAILEEIKQALDQSLFI